MNKVEKKEGRGRVMTLDLYKSPHQSYLLVVAASLVIRNASQYRIIDITSNDSVP